MRRTIAFIGLAAVFALQPVATLAQAGVNKTGPSLAGIVGRKSDAAVGYRYSVSRATANVTWDDATRDRFLAGLADFVPGTRMSVGVPSGADRRNPTADRNTLGWNARQDVEPPPQNGNPNTPLYRAARGCAFRPVDPRYGLRC
jgi:hypothetical protein